MLGPLYFISWIEAKYRPSTHQELHYLNFDLTNWAHENGNISKTISAMRSAKVAKWPQHNPLRLLFQWRGWKSTLSPSFITFSEREPFLRGFLWWIFWSQRSQRCIGVSKVCGRSFKSLRRKLAICEETLCSPLFHSLSNLLLVDQALLNLNTRWRSSSPDYCKILLISPWTKVLKVCMDKIYIIGNLDAYKIQ